MATKRDYYNILGVSKTANDSEIKSAYRKKARAHHPDVDKSSGADGRFKEVNEAYQVLSDAQKKGSLRPLRSRGFPRSGKNWSSWRF